MDQLEHLGRPRPTSPGRSPQLDERRRRSGPNLDIGGARPGRRSRSPAEVVDRLAEVLLQGDLAAEARRELAEFLVTGDEGADLAGLPRRRRLPAARRPARLLGLILALPEYHAC